MTSPASPAGSASAPAGVRARWVATLVWVALVVVFFRWWELTLRVPEFLLWTIVFLSVLVGITLILDPGRLRRRGDPLRRRTALWLGCVAGAALFMLAVPQVRIAGVPVSTVALGGVLDVVLPGWVLMIGLSTLWTGAARVGVMAGIAAVLLLSLWAFVVRMPGRSYRGALAPPDARESALRDRLDAHVRVLSVEIGERSEPRYEATQRAAAYVEGTLAGMGYAVGHQTFRWTDREYRNLEVEIPGGERAGEIVLVGAHYDTAEETPGADDNATGVAAALELARAFAGTRFPRTLRFVFFASEEPPFFATEWMGSAIYARRSRERGEAIVAMLSLESIGYYSSEPGSQDYPPPFSSFYPDRGDFIGFVGNLSSGRLVRRALATFRGGARFPSEGVAAPAWIPGVTWSDHLAFWAVGYRAIMVTGTAPFRNPFYHSPGDTMDRLDLDRVSRVVRGLEVVIRDLGTE